MLDRRYLAGSLILGFTLCLLGCSSPTLVSIAISPNAAYFSDAPGLTRQFTAIGTFAQGNHPKTTQDITDEVTWKSDATGIATVSSAGLATTTGVDYGTTGITARMNGFTGLIVANATVQVCEPTQKASSTGCN
jgi:hypothetical protein